MGFPITRLRRLRMDARLRHLVRETDLSPDRLILPLFVGPGRGLRQPIPSMPGHCVFSVDTLVEEARAAEAEGVQAVILFGIPENKDARASGAWDDNGIVQRALRALREKVPGLLRMGDVCLCEYTDHGHCGVLQDRKVVNDPTLELLARTAVSQARAGADVVAPSDMMDGRVGAIRRALDEAGWADLPILSYAAKYASAFYGPFRDAVQSTPSFGDRRTHQMDIRNRREALREIRLDLQEGADMVMVKPAMPCLDVISDTCRRYDVPVAAYQVSGEYACIAAASERGWVNRREIVLESLMAIRRAGATFIVTYFAREAARWLASAHGAAARSGSGDRQGGGSAP
ncbi:MAG: porphobilinogen synthase [Acidobacteriota bacterium]